MKRTDWEKQWFVNNWLDSHVTTKALLQVIKEEKEQRYLKK